MGKEFLQKVFLSVLLAFIFIGGFLFFNTSKAQTLETDCDINTIDSRCQQMGQLKCQDLLKKCLDYYQVQSDDYGKKIATSKEQQKTLNGEITNLNNKISKLKSDIQHNNLLIKDIKFQITDTESSITTTTGRIEDTRIKLAEILRTVSQYDKKSVLEILLSEDNLSTFFDEITALDVLNYKHQQLYEDITNLKIQLEEEKVSLDEEKDTLEKAVMISSLKAKENESLKVTKNTVLSQTKGEEAKYQIYLQEIQKKAQEIRKRIFELAQVSDTEAPSYEEAYAYAKYAGDTTGVRPAVILGLLEVESAIGKNVGQCNCAGKTYCKNPGITWKQIMPKSSWTAFEQITKELGLDTNATPISCSVTGTKVQSGGAMGPAQFMPSTWLNLKYKSRIETITGIIPANPWRVKDAFLAAGLYLKDWGADSKVLQKEIGAVTAYLCGTSSMTTSCIRAGGKSYRTSVMNKAVQWQAWIDQGVFNGK
jgi:peptidoglycan hydrolase CwlO-like protein